jgi:hypothetical protein
MIMLFESPILSQHLYREYLEDIKCALKNVDSIYYRWTNHKVGETEFPSEEVEKAYCERVFAYELYHQIRKIMDANPALERYQGVYLNGETIKNNKFYTDLFDGLSEYDSSFKEGEDNKRIPDLVLHRDLGSIEKEGQIYLAEIKMAENKNALDDLKKLTVLQKSKLNFTFYIFIYAGKNKDELYEELSKIDTSIVSKDIVCICSKFGESECMTFGEIIGK